MNTIKENMPFDDYRAIEAINASAIAHGETSMLHMHTAMTSNIDSQTPAMRWGSLSHAITLELVRFMNTAAVWDGATRRGKAWDEFKANAADPELIVTDSEMQQLATMQAMLGKNKTAMDLIDNSKREVSLQWESSAYGKAKARLDIYKPNEANGCGGYIADYKTTRSINPSAFFRSAYNLAYHVRMGWYVAGVEAITGERLPVYMIVQESSAPYDCFVCMMPDKIVDIGMEAAKEIATAYNIASHLGRYDGAVDGMIEYELPAWAIGGDNAEVNMEGVEL